MSTSRVAAPRPIRAGLRWLLPVVAVLGIAAAGILWYRGEARAERALLIQRLASTGHELDPPAGARRTIIEFTDYQCPICAEADMWLAPMVANGNTRVVVHHLPLEHIHAEAFDAAVAAQCAGRQGRFAAFHHWVFAHQEAVKQRDWSRMASDAGIPEIGAFAACMRDTSVRSTVKADQDAAAQLAIHGTPAFVVDGRTVYGIPSDTLFGPAAKR